MQDYYRAIADMYGNGGGGGSRDQRGGDYRDRRTSGGGGGDYRAGGDRGSSPSGRGGGGSGGRRDRSRSPAGARGEGSGGTVLKVRGLPFSAGVDEIAEFLNDGSYGLEAPPLDRYGGVLFLFF